MSKFRISEISYGPFWEKAQETWYNTKSSLVVMLGSKFGIGIDFDQSCFLFGKEYEIGSDEESEEYIAFMAKFRSLVWMTYRKNFVPMKPPSSFTSDTGWGCMLRSAQMLLANCLIRHLGDTEWGRCYPAVSNGHRNLLRWFLDAPKYFAFYSIHRMTECGRQYNMEPGEWYGPNTVALVLRDLVANHCTRVENIVVSEPKFLEKDYYSLRSGKSQQNLAVLVTEDGNLYLDEAFALCVSKSETVSNNDNSIPKNEKDKSTTNNNDKDNSNTNNDDKDNYNDQDNTQQQNDPLLNPSPEPKWDSALLLMIPVRLGLNELNDGYVAPLIEALKFPQCIGMIGGKPAHSLYFVGSQNDNFIYLDPHTVQSAATNSECDDEFFPYQQTVDSYHCTTPRLIKGALIDPSLAIGFYCTNAKELNDLVARLGQLESIGLPFMSIFQTRPKYDFDIDGEEDDVNNEEEGDGGDDDDDDGMETASESGERASKEQEQENFENQKDENQKDEDEDDEFVFL